MRGREKKASPPRQRPLTQEEYIELYVEPPVHSNERPAFGTGKNSFRKQTSKVEDEKTSDERLMRLQERKAKGRAARAAEIERKLKRGVKFGDEGVAFEPNEEFREIRSDLRFQERETLTCDYHVSQVDPNGYLVNVKMISADLKPGWRVSFDLPPNEELSFQADGQTEIYHESLESVHMRGFTEGQAAFAFRVKKHSAEKGMPNLPMNGYLANDMKATKHAINFVGYMAFAATPGQNQETTTTGITGSDSRRFRDKDPVRMQKMKENESKRRANVAKKAEDDAMARRHQVRQEQRQIDSMLEKAREDEKIALSKHEAASHESEMASSKYDEARFND